MAYDFSKFGTSELYDFLTEITLRYNHILLHGGSQEEFDRLADVLEIIQVEIQRRIQEKRNKGQG